ncbi:leucine-rich repeat protein [uncultured Ruminococcus sp.]|uniref:leucine-rich repeat protein n=1 Tax=uncultured Ruminococcus sp. TaxID=165186 RepID=UPI00262B3737|nr:leucine-rich repeat protein [uncultured Ruminococcus sp.]
MKLKSFFAASATCCLLISQMTGTMPPVQQMQVTAETYVSPPDSVNPWELDENGVLTISGTGTMTDNSWIETLGSSNIALIKKVVIAEGITGIGESYFHGVHFSDLSSLDLPKSLNVIEKDAFNNCFGLTELVIPVNTVLVENQALSYCPDLERVTFLNPHCSIESAVPGLICGYEGSTAQEYAQAHYVSFLNIETSEQTDYVEVTEPPKYSGECGADLTWQYKDNGTLTISGTGDMYDFSCSDVPWGHLTGSIVSVTLEPGITSIGSNAFFGFSRMKDINVPEGVERIGEDVFHACGITTLTLPRSLKYVGRRTFDNALSLAYIKFLNPECEVESEQGYPYVRIIYGYDNSTAQELAEEWGCKFISLGDDEHDLICLGDGNADGEFDLADVVLFQKWLLGSSDVLLNNWKAADLNNDDKLDVFDLILMKRALVEKHMFSQ